MLALRTDAPGLAGSADGTRSAYGRWFRVCRGKAARAVVPPLRFDSCEGADWQNTERAADQQTATQDVTIIHVVVVADDALFPFFVFLLL